MGPGERAMPVHLHADEEELFYVLGGAACPGRTVAAMAWLPTIASSIALGRSRTR
jgi:hypothetical protein